VKFPSQDHFEQPYVIVKTGQAFLSIMDTPIHRVVIKYCVIHSVKLEINNYGHSEAAVGSKN